MQLNLPILLLAALVPLIMGFIWYHPKVFGTVWMKAAGITEESKKGANMALIFGLTYVFSVLIAMTLNFATIHQWALVSLLADKPDLMIPDSDSARELKGLMDLYGDKFRTFKHGAFHGFLIGFMIALPVLGVNALFERKKFKYIAVNGGFWIISIMIMGGIICAYA